jgi:hypothetical protein
MSDMKPDPVSPEHNPAGRLSGSTRSARCSASKGRYFPRRDQRVHLEMPVRVYGYGTDKRPFVQETRTVNVSAHGARIVLTATVSPEQKIILTNMKTREDVVCRVVHLQSARSKRTEVGIEFIHDAPRFWHMAFPPRNWDPAERKRPGSCRA